MTYFLCVWIDNDPTEHVDLDSVLRELKQRPLEISEAIERTETGAIIWSAGELSWALRMAQQDLVDENRHNNSLAVAE